MPEVSQDFPFDQYTLVFRRSGKIFALCSIKNIDSVFRVNLKCEPQRALLLRDEYAGISPGYHMNKKHWNTIDLYEGDVPDELFYDLLDHSYDLVKK